MVSRSCCYDTAVVVALLCGGVNVGLNLGIVGPTIPDLALLTGATITAVSNVLVWRSLAFIIASLVGSFVFGKVDDYMLLGITLLLQAVTTAASASFSNLYLMFTIQSFANFFSTLVVIGVSFLVFRLERSQSRRVAQAVFLLFNIGKTVIPFIVGPFLAPETNRTTTTIPPRNQTISDFVLASSNATSSGDGDEAGLTHVAYAYAIVGLFSVFMSVLYIGIAIARRCKVADSAEEKRTENSEQPSQAAGTSGGATRLVIVMAIFSLHSFVLNGIEFIDSGLMMTFVTEYLHRSKAMGLVVTGVYQGVKAFVCLVLVLVITRLHSSTILLADAICMVAASAGMAASVSANSDAGFYVTIVLMAAGMSNYYASLLSWLELQYAISPRVSGILTIFMGFSGMAFPPLLTYLLEEFGAIAYPVTVLVLCALCLALIGVTKGVLQEPFCPKIKTVVIETPIDEEREPLLTEDGGSPET